MPEVAPLIVALLALVTVGVSAWLLGRRAGRRTTPPLTLDQTLQLLRSARPRSRPVRGNPSATAPGPDTDAEIEFELGALFRRRGEVGLATELHSRLQVEAAPELRDRARFELALDFISAGLMDRAERLLNELATTPGYRHLALERLVRLHERQGDWSNALSAWSQLSDHERDARRVAAAHYFCELADQALLQGDPDRADNLLRQARAQDSAPARTRVLAGRIEERRGHALAALEHYVAAAQQATALLPELLPHIVALAHRSGAMSMLTGLQQGLRSSGQLSERQLELLVDAKAHAAPAAGRAHDEEARYVCADCGLQSVAWGWHCPACFAWERFRSLLIRDGSD